MEGGEKSVDVDIEHVDEAVASFLEQARQHDTRILATRIQKPIAKKKFSQTRRKPAVAEVLDANTVLMGSPPVKVDVTNRKVISADEFFKKFKPSKPRLGSDRQTLRRQMLVDQQDAAVYSRLQKSRSEECELSNFECLVNACHRVFESVRVLAWHMSYSHRDETRQPQCLVCGQCMTSTKGKNSHLVSAHRDLSILHNAQCVQQCLPSSAKNLDFSASDEADKSSGIPLRKFVLEGLYRKVTIDAPTRDTVNLVDCGAAGDFAGNYDNFDISGVNVSVDQRNTDEYIRIEEEGEDESHQMQQVAAHVNLNTDDTFVVDVGGIDDLQVASNYHTIANADHNCDTHYCQPIQP